MNFGLKNILTAFLLAFEFVSVFFPVTSATCHLGLLILDLHYTRNMRYSNCTVLVDPPNEDREL
jgi:hypothetical protein